MPGYVSRPVFFALLILMCAQAAHAQTGALLTGTVTDEFTRLPIPGSAVILLRMDGSPILSAFTDSLGRFRLNVPGPGDYNVRAERIGYGIAETGGLRLGERDAIGFEFRLAPKAILLDSILVKGARAPALRPTEQLIHGRLLDDETRRPIPQGSIELREPGGRARARTITDANGLFRIVSPTPGAYRLHAEHIGYQSAEQDLVMMLGDTLRLDFHLSTQAILLAPILVTASARPVGDRRVLAGMEELYSRMNRMRDATFLTRDSIARYEAMGVGTGQMLLRSAGIFSDSQFTVRGCAVPPRYYVDGAEIPADLTISIEDMYPPGVLEAIEVHRGPRIPAELNRGFPCAVIVIWTRR
jgi:hypothetical protein